MNKEAAFPSPDDLVADLSQRDATMEQIARLKDPVVTSPEAALETLKSGNARFYSGQPQRVFSDVNQRRAQIMAQTPFAVVFGCADSRVPLEIVFDQGPGDIFSIRVAGHVISPGTLASVQYAVSHLKIQLIVVLGHEGCGAVAASLPEASRPDGSQIAFLYDCIAPALEDLPPLRDSKARMREAVVRNVLHQKALLENDSIVKEAVESGRVQVVGAYYEIGSGAVDFLEG